MDEEEEEEEELLRFLLFPAKIPCPKGPLRD